LSFRTVASATSVDSSLACGLVLEFTYREYRFAPYLVKLQLVDRIRPDYFAALLNTPYYKHLFQGRCKKAVGQSNISQTLLKEFPALSPPAGLQTEYALVVAKHRRLHLLRNLETIIDEWIETAQASGRPIPIPQGRLMFA
jgi:hypothetical protein